MAETTSDGGKCPLHRAEAALREAAAHLKEARDKINASCAAKPAERALLVSLRAMEKLVDEQLRKLESDKPAGGAETVRIPVRTEPRK